MNTPPPPYDPGQYVAPRIDPPRSRSLAPLIIGVLLLVVAVLALAGFAAYHATTKIVADATPPADAFLADLQHHDFKAANAAFIPGARAVATTQKLRVADTAMEASSGRLTGWGKPQWYVESTTSGTFVFLTYPVTFVQGTGTVRVTMQREASGSQYGVYRFDYSL